MTEVSRELFNSKEEWNSHVTEWDIVKIYVNLLLLYLVIVVIMCSNSFLLKKFIQQF